MNESNQPNYARAKEAAQHLKIARSTLWQWASERKNEGFPQPIKLGQKVTLFDLNAIDAFVAAQAVKGGSK
jgi:predicted DNA-binding transcriptional regulator AlpA